LKIHPEVILRWGQQGLVRSKITGIKEERQRVGIPKSSIKMVKDLNAAPHGSFYELIKMFFCDRMVSKKIYRNWFRAAGMLCGIPMNQRRF
jgi:hypothetical protein